MGFRRKFVANLIKWKWCWTTRPQLSLRSYDFNNNFTLDLDNNNSSSKASTPTKTTTSAIAQLDNDVLLASATHFQVILVIHNEPVIVPCSWSCSIAFNQNHVWPNRYWVDVKCICSILLTNETICPFLRRFFLSSLSLLLLFSLAEKSNGKQPIALSLSSGFCRLTNFDASWIVGVVRETEFDAKQSASTFYVFDLCARIIWTFFVCRRPTPVHTHTHSQMANHQLLPVEFEHVRHILNGWQLSSSIVQKVFCH